MKPASIPGSARLLVVVGPSGAGKDSVLRAWRGLLDDLPGKAPVHFARRVITRPAEPNENHEPASDAAFDDLQSGSLATWWRANGLRYGVRWQDVAPLERSQWVVVNGSRAHLPALRSQAPALKAVAITASSQVLAQRLVQRRRDTADEVAARLARTVDVDVDVAIVNECTVGDAAARLHRWWLALSSGQAG